MGITQITTRLIKNAAVTLAKLGALSTKGDLLSHTGAAHVAIPVGNNHQWLKVENTNPNGVEWSAILTAKGSLIAGNGTNEVGVPVGADAQILLADSTQAAGIKWASAGLSVYYARPLTSVESDGIGATSIAQLTFTQATGGALSVVFPANFFAAGTSIVVDVFGRYSTGTNTNIQFRGFFGGTSGVNLIDSAQLSTFGAGAVTNRMWRARLHLRTTTAGVSGVVQANGLTIFSDQNKSSQITATVDTTAAQTLTFTWTFSVSNGSNVARISDFTVLQTN